MFYFLFYDKAIHSSSLYSFHKTVAIGLQVGSSSKEGQCGVYAFPMVRRDFALSSSGYAVYSDIGHCGMFWSVRYELAVARFMAGSPGIGKMTVGTSSRGYQWVCKRGTYHVMAVWFHAVHQDDLSKLRHLCNLDHWHPECEIT